MFPLALCLALAAPQGPAGDESAPQGLTVVVAQVGQGDGLLLKTPDGAVHVVDGGPPGQGTATLIPLITALQPSRYGATFMSHWHIDHQGGLDEVLARFPFSDAYDRGDTNRPNYPETQDYLNAAGSRRRALIAGQVVQLGGGVSATVVAVNGQIKGGDSVPVVGTAQEENSRSLTLRIDYGQFSLWLGGDLTGGGGNTADVETKATLACGNVDVYHVNHHGSTTSTSVNLLANLAPELALVSCGSNNPYGHPATQTTNRINQAAAARLLLSTTAGTGTVGFGVGGHITLTSDGRRYRATAQNGRFLDFLVDELTATTPATHLRISEVHRQPLAVSEGRGEYVEVTNTGAGPASLRNVQVQTSGGVFTIVTNLLAYPGRPVTLMAHGDPQTNGGLPLGIVWPYQGLSLGNTSDTLRLVQNAQTLDQVAYAAGFPGGAGVAAERRDLLAPPSVATFAAATNLLPGGDKGSPGARNPGETTSYAARIQVEASPTQLVLRATDLAHGGRLSVVALAFGSTPGFPLWNAQVPLNVDALFTFSLGLPDFILTLPAEGYRALTLDLPQPNPLKGYPAFAAHLVLDLVAPSVIGLSGAAPFTFL